MVIIIYSIVIYAEVKKFIGIITVTVKITAFLVKLHVFRVISILQVDPRKNIVKIEISQQLEYQKYIVK